MKPYYTEILKRAKTIIVERGWTKHDYARDAQGYGCSALDDRAVCFCSIGAVRRATMEYAADHPGMSLIDSPLFVALGSSLPYADGGSHLLHMYNDKETTTKDDVVAVFDRAITKSEVQNA